MDETMKDGSGHQILSEHLLADGEQNGVRIYSCWELEALYSGYGVESIEVLRYNRVQNVAIRRVKDDIRSPHPHL